MFNFIKKKTKKDRDTIIDKRSINNTFEAVENIFNDINFQIEKISESLEKSDENINNIKITIKDLNYMTGYLNLLAQSTKMHNISIKKLSESAIIPTRGSDHAAGYDLYADNSEVITILPNETKVIGTGISMAIPEGYFGLLCARSGISIKRGLAPANKIGVIDSDYRGEFLVALHNHSDETQVVGVQERIAQLIVSPFASVDFVEVDDLDVTDRGEGGLGSTGTGVVAEGE